MYMFKDDVVNVYNQRAIARQTGASIQTINRIFKRKQKCSKLLAFCICKTINPNAEIEDYFDYYKKGD